MLLGSLLAFTFYLPTAKKKEGGKGREKNEGRTVKHLFPREGKSGRRAAANLLLNHLLFSVLWFSTRKNSKGPTSDGWCLHQALAIKLYKSMTFFFLSFPSQEALALFEERLLSHQVTVGPRQKALVLSLKRKSVANA